MRTEFEFVLPRGYLDGSGTLHKRGTMRLATARDELQPLRDPTVTGPDDPRLTLLVLARVVESLGTLDMVTTHEIEGLFAADLAYLQDFYGVINFGTDADIDALLAAQSAGTGAGGTAGSATGPAHAPQTASEPSPPPAQQAEPVRQATPTPGDDRPVGGRRAAIEEVPSGHR